MTDCKKLIVRSSAAAQKILHRTCPAFIERKASPFHTGGESPTREARGDEIAKAGQKS